MPLLIALHIELLKAHAACNYIPFAVCVLQEGVIIVLQRVDICALLNTAVSSLVCNSWPLLVPFY